MTELDHDTYQLHLAVARRQRGLHLGVITFDPADHPRDLKGRFRVAVAGMKPGDKLKLPDRTSIEKYGNSFIVRGAKQAVAKNVDEAVDKAIESSAFTPHGTSIGGSSQFTNPQDALDVHEGRKKWDKMKLVEVEGPAEIPMPPEVAESPSAAGYWNAGTHVFHPDSPMMKLVRGMSDEELAVDYIGAKQNATEIERGRRTGKLRPGFESLQPYLDVQPGYKKGGGGGVSGIRAKHKAQIEKTKDTGGHAQNVKDTRMLTVEDLRKLDDSDFAAMTPEEHDWVMEQIVRDDSLSEAVQDKLMKRVDTAFKGKPSPPKLDTTPKPSKSSQEVEEAEDAFNDYNREHYGPLWSMENEAESEKLAEKLREVYRRNKTPADQRIAGFEEDEQDDVGLVQSVVSPVATAVQRGRVIDVTPTAKDQYGRERDPFTIRPLDNGTFELQDEDGTPMPGSYFSLRAAGEAIKNKLQSESRASARRSIAERGRSAKAHNERLHRGGF